MQKLKWRKGFTLIEMVIVIAVVGILMAIAFNGIRGVQSSARDTKRVADLKSVQSYLELYFNKCGHYPGDATCGTSQPDWATMSATLVTTVAASGDIPTAPPGAGAYVYSVDNSDLEYVLQAPMERTRPRGGFVGGKAWFATDCSEANAAKLYCVSN